MEKSTSPVGLLQGKAAKCARPGLLHGKAEKRFRAGGGPGGEKKPVFFFFSGGPTRMYKEGRASFSEKKKLTFRPVGVMNVLAGREAAQKAQTWQVGKAAAETGGTP